ncbi:MAG: hypothetical protein Harvfovirus6_38 [Harvfovirus sp.]|uniref:Uncharacterized protein n=1 Tax=Harvfovirus sp. TaxID=2487768 RepID=A0A3G5A0S0_9VIRU|nr:MAG: hypothetical protein Harvfovirus6_38 [Harvfovirus sp.]
MEQFLPEAQKRFLTERKENCKLPTIFDLPRYISDSTIQRKIKYEIDNLISYSCLILRINQGPTEYFIMFSKKHECIACSDCNSSVDLMGKITDASSEAEIDYILQHYLFNMICSGIIYSSWDALLKATKDQNDILYRILSPAEFKSELFLK